MHNYHFFTLLFILWLLSKSFDILVSCASALGYFRTFPSNLHFPRQTSFKTYLLAATLSHVIFTCLVAQTGNTSSRHIGHFKTNKPTLHWTCRTETRCSVTRAHSHCMTGYEAAAVSRVSPGVFRDWRENGMCELLDHLSCCNMSVWISLAALKQRICERYHMKKCVPIKGTDVKGDLIQKGCSNPHVAVWGHSDSYSSWSIKAISN